MEKVSNKRLKELSYWDESTNELDALMATIAADLLSTRKELERVKESNAREVAQFSDGYKAAKAGLPEIAEPHYEINEDQWRVGYAWGMYDELVKRSASNPPVCLLVSRWASMDENTYDNVVTEKRLNAASDLLEAISIWFYENKGLAGKADPTWTGLYRHACQLFEPTYKEK